MKNKDETFSFAISLSVLDHLGRHLYRSFVTVLGEAISNSWDADAQNVSIYVDRKNNTLVIKDDGVGMTADDFQNKFLKIGYSKRKTGESKSNKGRPFIGRKGIGKLALLSCAEEITVISKTEGQEYIGGVIENSGLDAAITEDLTPQDYKLGKWNKNLLKKYTKNHKHGTIIYFNKINDGIKNSADFLKKTLALYFRFSLLDSSFHIFLDDEEISLADLKDLTEKTEFLWNINNYEDPYIDYLTKLEEKKDIAEGDFKGFIASVMKPRFLKVISAEERASVDLFVNGRLREKDILRHIPQARIVEDYLYGQIHYDELDDDEDRFATSREGVVADDPKFKKLLEVLEKLIRIVINDWDKWRLKNKEDGDPDNKRISKKERKSRELFNEVSRDYTLPKKSTKKDEVDDWVNSIAEDAQFNFTSYAECFISENLIRKYVEENKVALTKEATSQVTEHRKRETRSKNAGNISIDLRQLDRDLSYLDMADLANLVDKKDPAKEACLPRDAKEYKPVRDALMHTALLTDDAKHKLTAVYSNIKGRIKNLISK